MLSCRHGVPGSRRPCATRAAILADVPVPRPPSLEEIQAIEEAAQWRDDVTVAINLSPAQMKNPSLIATVVGALAASQLDPSRLEIEIVESVLMDETEHNIRTLHALRELGVKIALDDFGTGYSSLSYLRAFPFDKIKIDRSFIVDLMKKDGSTAIIRSITALADALGMETTAEGVEDIEQVDVLRAQGCSSIQGYLLSKPVHDHEVNPFIALLQSRAGEFRAAA